MAKGESRYRFEYPKNRMYKWISIIFVVWYILDLKLNFVEDNETKLIMGIGTFLILVMYYATLAGEIILSPEGIRITGLSFNALSLKNKFLPFSKIKSIEHFKAEEVSLLGKKMKLRGSEKVNEVRIRYSKDYPLFNPLLKKILANVLVLPILNPEEFIKEIEKYR